MDFNSDTIQIVLSGAGGALVALGMFYAGFRSAIKKMGESIPGPDFFEELDAKLAGADDIIEAIERGVDKLNPNTHGGAGSGPDVRPAA